MNDDEKIKTMVNGDVNKLHLDQDFPCSLEGQVVAVADESDHCFRGIRVFQRKSRYIRA